MMERKQLKDVASKAEKVIDGKSRKREINRQVEKDKFCVFLL
jgi:hypothetical protein